VKILKNLALTALVISLFIQEASAMDMACSKIMNAGNSDYDFSEICLNDQYAVLEIGPFEGTRYLYTLTPGMTLANMVVLSLKPAIAKGMKMGKPISVMVVDYNSKDIMTSLKEGGSVIIDGSPESLREKYFAREFIVKDIRVSL